VVNFQLTAILLLQVFMLGIQHLGQSAADIAKYVQKAEKALQRGRLKAALSQYLRVLRLDPANAGAKESVAEVYASLNQPALAAEQLSEVFHFYAEKLNLSKATLIYKRLSRLRPVLPEEALLFAQLSERTNQREAVLAYEAALNGYRTLRRDQEIFEILERLTKLDPTAERFQQLADAAIKQGRTREAAAAYTGVALEFQRHGVDGSGQFAKAYELNPGNAGAALGHGSALLETDAMQAVRILEPLANYPSSPAEAREPYGIALMRAGRPMEAEPYLWELFQRDPRNWLEKVIELIGHTIDAGQEEYAVDLSLRLEEFQRRVGMRREFVALTKRMAGVRQPGPVFLEYLATLYDSANHETDLTATLAKLFDHYLLTGDFERATGALERAVEVDAYEGGHQARLESLRGKVDSERLGGLHHRLAGIRTATAIQEENPPAANHLAVLEDLMVEAELFCRYSLTARAAGTLAKIREIFPFEEEHNERLRELCLALGVKPRGAPAVGFPAPASILPRACGLLKRSSYIEVLLAEVARAKAQRTPLTLLLMEFAVPDSAHDGACALQELMQNAGGTLCAHLRHSDLAVRYGPAQIAVLLASTPEKDASLVIDDLRRALKRASGDNAPVLTVGVAEANLDALFDAADIATEVINRVEDALEQAKSAEAGAAFALAYSAPNLRLA
jgi:tetratricopeptide (TPR) repeat protein